MQDVESADEQIIVPSFFDSPNSENIEIQLLEESLSESDSTSSSDSSDSEKDELETTMVSICHEGGMGMHSV